MGVNGSICEPAPIESSGELPESAVAWVCRNASGKQAVASLVVAAACFIFSRFWRFEMKRICPNCGGGLVKAVEYPHTITCSVCNKVAIFVSKAPGGSSFSMTLVTWAGFKEAVKRKILAMH